VHENTVRFVMNVFCDNRCYRLDILLCLVECPIFLDMLVSVLYVFLLICIL